MNKTLLAQIKYHLGSQETIPGNFNDLLQAISAKYDLYEQEHNQDHSRDQDITNTQNAEAIFLEGEYKFRSLIENSSDAITVINDRFQVLYASDTMQRITGFLPEEVKGTTFADFVHPDDMVIVSNYFNELVNTPGVTKTLIFRCRKKDGSYYWCERTSRNLLNDPAIRGIISNYRDITDRIEAETELKNSEHKFRYITEYASDSLVILNEQLIIIYASASMFRITGYTEQEILNTPALDYLHPDDLLTIKDALTDLLNNVVKTKSLSFRKLKKDGTYMWCDGIATNLVHEPTVGGIVVNYRDITERKSYEDALKASNEDLKKTNSELDRFVYSVSHDLRAPLSSMLGIIGLMEAEGLNEESIEDLGYLKDSVYKLDGFIIDILNYSKNARLDVRKDEINFKPNLEGIVKNLKFMDGINMHIDIRVNINSHQPFYSDKNRIGVILNNLISNAIRYRNTTIPNPIVEIAVDVSDNEAQMTVKDNGIGISKENQHKVFEMFYRLSTQSVGSGLGLYIVKETVEKMNGYITLESEPGKGTTFKIVIPNLINN